MPTDRPRIQVTLDDQTSAALNAFAATQDRSLSSCAADLIREALALHEDALLSRLGDQRLQTTQEWIAHDTAWR